MLHISTSSHRIAAVASVAAVVAAVVAAIDDDDDDDDACCFCAQFALKISLTMQCPMFSSASAFLFPKLLIH